MSRSVSQAVLGVLVMALAIWEAGPHEPSDWRLGRLWGAQQDPPPVMALCNGRELEERKCPKTREGYLCGGPYFALKPALPGTVLDKLFDYDKRECARFRACPTIYSHKQLEDECQPVVQR